MASTVDRLADRLVAAGLPSEAVESFRRVVVVAAVSPDAASASASELDDGEHEVRIVARAGGEPLKSEFSTSSDAHAQRVSRRLPPFAVCLAYHAASDVFTLLAFSPESIPCELARFDRDGKAAIGKWKVVHDVRAAAATSGQQQQQPQPFLPYLWSVDDARVLVAAAEQCRGYFLAAADDDSADDDNNADRAECLRLVPRRPVVSAGDNTEGGGGGDASSPPSSTDGEGSREAEREAEAIRALILSQLLSNKPPAGGGDTTGNDSTMTFRHPDPNFLMPLSRAIASELGRWRHLCASLPPSASWPDLPPDEEEELEANIASKGEGTEEDKVCGEVGTDDRELFDEIMAKRRKQVNKSQRLVKRALKRMHSLLLRRGAFAEAEGVDCGTAAAFELGSGRVASLLSLVQLQRRHWEGWDDCNDALDMVCENQSDDHRKKMDDTAAALLDWYEEGEMKVEDDSQEEGEKLHEADFDADSAARVTINDWKKDDAELFAALSSAFAIAKGAIKSGEEATRKTAADEIQSIKRELDAGRKKAHSNSIRNVARLVKLWNAFSDDEEDDYDAWHERTEWTKDQEEAYLSFGLRITTPQPLFLVDQAGVADYLQYLIDDLAVRKERGYYDDDTWSEQEERGYYDDDTWSEQENRFKRRWKRSIASILDCALKSISNFSQAGDLCNASRLLVVCLRFLCRSKTVGQLRDKFRDPDDSGGANKIVMSQLREEVVKFDVYAVRTAFKYFEGDANVSSALFFHGEAQWFYNVLKSGIVFFPDENSYVDWRKVKRGWSDPKREAHWYTEAHEAVAIFSHHGWRHPILRCALSEDAKPADIKRWKRWEGPLVIKERFLALRDQDEANQAIALAKMMGGDHEALHFLVSVGRTEDAIDQANHSDNERGLEQLASDLIDENQRASFLCAQAHILCAIEKAKRNKKAHMLQRDSIDIFVDLFLKRWLSSLVDPSTRTSSEPGSAYAATVASAVPPLSCLCIMAATRGFMAAATSTSEMQILLEKLDSPYSGNSDISFLLAVAALAVICRTAPVDAYYPAQGLRYALSRAGLLSSYSRESCSYSGALLDYAFPHDLPGEELLAGMAYAVFECSRYETERHSVWKPDRRGFHTAYLDFAVRLLSAVCAAVLSGSQNFALQTMQAINNKCGEGYQSRSEEPTFTCFAACFSRLFCSGNSQQRCPALHEQLLKTALSLRISEFVPDATSKEQVWVAVAYSKHAGFEKAASLLAESVFFNRSNTTDERPTTFYRAPVKALEHLSLVDTIRGAHLAEKNAMSAFALTSRRARLDKSERQQMCSAYFRQLLTLSMSSGIPIWPGWIAKCVRIDSAVNPSFWNLQSDEVDSWLTQSTGVSPCFSDKQGLHHVCRILYFVDSEISRGEQWSTRYFIFSCGLRWLRSALLSTGLPAFDHLREQLSGNWKCRFDEDNATLFEPDHWRTPDRSTYRGHWLDDLPLFSAYAVTTIVKKYALEIEKSALNISHLCHEALTLCRIMFFFLSPSQSNFKSIADIDTAKAMRLEPGFQIPLHLEPENLLDSVLRCDWGTKGEFAYSHEEKHFAFDSEVASAVPHLIPRIVLAVGRGRTKEAAALCVTQGKKGISWDVLSKKNSCGIRTATKNARELVQCCLLTLRASATTSTELPEAFINISTHIILTMNWFQCCRLCSFSAPIFEDSHELVPSAGNIKALRNAASVWSDALENNDYEPAAYLKTCARMVCCLDRCLDRVESFPTDREGCLCRVKDEVYEDNVDTETSARLSSKEMRAKERRKRKRKREFDVEADFTELKSFISQIHLKDPCDWIDHVLPRIKAALGSSDETHTARPR